ncbi:MAG: helix-turn-helix transcriptional regulator [Firmicutes bacterium]|nr:helix-turn-helix transcriptional regulator [Bacillota bacterium]
MSGQCKNNEKCVLKMEKLLSLIGSKWTLLVLRELAAGERRFSQIQKALEGISPKTLSTRLQELENAGIILRKVFAEVPPHVEYSLTQKGEELRHILDSLFEWAARYKEQQAD